jgi:hypothetical protein
VPFVVPQQQEKTIRISLLDEMPFLGQSAANAAAGNPTSKRSEVFWQQLRDKCFRQIDYYFEDIVL